MCWAREEPEMLAQVDSAFSVCVYHSHSAVQVPISPTQTRSLNSFRAGACLLHSFMITCIHRILLIMDNQYAVNKWVHHSLLKILPRTLRTLACKDMNTENWKAYPSYLWHLNSTLTLHHSDSLCTLTSCFSNTPNKESEMAPPDNLSLTTGIHGRKNLTSPPTPCIC